MSLGAGSRASHSSLSTAVNCVTRALGRDVLSRSCPYWSSLIGGVPLDASKRDV
ncbi:hypothetical protein SK128_023364, partial [Halocaridina rubra]